MTSQSSVGSQEPHRVRPLPNIVTLSRESRALIVRPPTWTEKPVEADPRPTTIDLSTPIIDLVTPSPLAGQESAPLLTSPASDGLPAPPSVPQSPWPARSPSIPAPAILPATWSTAATVTPSWASPSLSPMSSPCRTRDSRSPIESGLSPPFTRPAFTLLRSGYPFNPDSGPEVYNVDEAEPELEDDERDVTSGLKRDGGTNTFRGRPQTRYGEGDGCVTTELGHQSGYRRPRASDTQISQPASPDFSIFAVPTSTPPSPEPPGETDPMTSIEYQNSASDLPPMPERPGRRLNSPAPIIERQPSPPLVRERARPPSGVLKPTPREPPSAAPKYNRKRAADYRPWTGNGPEDSLSDYNIRSGFYDRMKMAREEFASSRTALWPVLNYRHGIRRLSNFFASALRQRHNRGRITAPSTFKPPPRVTLTDSKREAWLRDLANAAVPLRRLSRTIPHGIRGKVLLDQCLTKNIPTARAVWLAKCVGANEMRAFKRKGASAVLAMGGEGKWVRDWTLMLQQFIEGVITACGEEGWKAKMSYSIRLVSHFFSEHLLDKEQYIDWLLTSYEAAPSETLPVWILIVQIHTRELLKSRRHSRRLILSALTRVNKLYTEDEESYAPLLEILSRFLTPMMLSSPESFILPRTWSSHRLALKSVMDKYNSGALAVFEALDDRNQKLTLRERRPMTLKSSRNCLSETLDATPYHRSTKDLSDHCIELFGDHGSAIKELLRYVISPFRKGVANLYLIARLLRSWHDSGIDTQQAILGYLLDVPQTRTSNRNIYFLVSELIRSGHFSVSEYLQWLIINGDLPQSPASSYDPPIYAILLGEIPLTDLPLSMLNLRRRLLRNCGIVVDSEPALLHRALSCLRAQLPGVHAECLGSTGRNDEPSQSAVLIPDNLDGSVHAELGDRVLDFVQSHLFTGPSDGASSSKEFAGPADGFGLPLAQFLAIRTFLERLRAFSVLAEILKAASKSINSLVLASVADTLTYNLDTFAAIGVLDDLLTALLARLKVLKVCKSLERCVLVSYAHLASRIPGRQETARYVAAELYAFDQKSAVAANSPVSDFAADAISSELDLNDEIERLMSTGTSMADSTMERIFKMVTSSMRGNSQKSNPLLLSRLRTFDPKLFDELMNTWIAGLLRSEEPAELFHIMSSLVIAECLTIRSMVVASTAYLRDSAAGGKTLLHGIVSLEILRLVTPRSVIESDGAGQDWYRFRLQQALLVRDHPGLVMTVISQALTFGSAVIDDQSGHSLCKLLAEQSILALIQSTLIHRPVDIETSLLAPTIIFSRARGKPLHQIADCLLDLAYRKEYTDAEPAVKMTTVLALADDLSLSFCQFKLRLMLDPHLQLSSSIVRKSTSRSASLVKDGLFVGLRDVKAENEFVITSLIAVVDDSVANSLRVRAETSLLNSLRISKHAESLVTQEDQLKRHLFILEALTSPGRSSSSTTKPSAFALRLDSLSRAFGRARFPLLRPKDYPELQGSSLDEVQLKLIYLLHLVVIFYAAHPSSSHPPPKETISVLLSLSRLLSRPSLRPYSAVATFILDTAMLVLDHLPPTRSNPASTDSLFHTRHHLPTLRFLFCPAPPPITSSTTPVTSTDETWLGLVRRRRVPRPPRPPPPKTPSSSRLTAREALNIARSGGAKARLKQPTSGSGSGRLKRGAVKGANAEGKRTIVVGRQCPYPLRRWEILQDPTPILGVNDASLSLGSFDACKI